MIFKNNIINIAFLGLIVISICLLTLPKENVLMTNSKVVEKPKIILDAGHGGLTNTID